MNSNVCLIFSKKFGQWSTLSGSATSDVRFVTRFYVKICKLNFTCKTYNHQASAATRKNQKETFPEDFDRVFMETEI